MKKLFSIALVLTLAVLVAQTSYASGESGKTQTQPVQDDVPTPTDPCE